MAFINLPNMKIDLSAKWLWQASLALFAVLLMLWGMPGTIGLRNVLMGFLLVLSALGFWFGFKINRFVAWPKPIWTLIILSCWLLINTLLNDSDVAKGLSEYRGQWVSALLFAAIGYFLSMLASERQNGTERLLSILFWAILIQIVFNNVISLLFYIEVGVLPLRADPYSMWPELLTRLANGARFIDIPIVVTPDKFSYTIGIFNALVAAEICNRISGGKTLLKQNNFTLVFGLIMSVITCGILSLRNGYIELLFLFGLSAIFLVTNAFRKSNKKVIYATFSGIAFCGSILIVGLQSDPRWSGFSESVTKGMNSENDLDWLTPLAPLPKLADGRPVDNAYFRVAWANEGVTLIKEHPLGTGYNRNAYGLGIDKKYKTEGRAKNGHSHSGIIDFTIANGLPSLVLWLAFNFTLLFEGVVGLRQKSSTAGLMLIFFVLCFNLRSVIDSTIRDHMLQQYMFLTIMLSTVIELQKKGLSRG